MADDLLAVRTQVARQVAHWRAAVIALEDLDELRVAGRVEPPRALPGPVAARQPCRARSIAYRARATCWPRSCARPRPPTSSNSYAAMLSDSAGNSSASRPGSSSTAAPSTTAHRPSSVRCSRRATSWPAARLESILTPLGKPIPPVLTYIDKGLGARSFGPDFACGTAGRWSVAAAIKLTRHNLNGRPTALLHEAGHQIAFMLDWNDELADALRRELRDDPELAEAWSGWSSEIAGDCVGFVHAGYAAVAALHDVIAGEAVNVYARRPFDPHPLAHLRVLLGTAMATRFFGEGPWTGLARAWLVAHPVAARPPDVRPLIERSIPRLPRIVEVCLLEPMRAFGGRPLDGARRPDARPAGRTDRAGPRSRRVARHVFALALEREPSAARPLRLSLGDRTRPGARDRRRIREPGCSASAEASGWPLRRLRRMN